MANLSGKTGGLRRRLVLSLLVPLSLILLVSSVVDYRLAGKTTDSAFDESLADTVFDLESHIRDDHAGTLLNLSDEAEAMLRSNAPDLVYFALRNAQGALLAGDADVPVLASSEDEGLIFRDGIYKGVAVRIALHHLSREKSAVQVVVMETTQKRDAARRSILATILAPNLAVVLATLLAVLFGVRHGLLPLKALEDDIAARSSDDLHEFKLADAPVEVQPILARLNTLFGQLAESSAVQRRFIADAAHQLRTPLAALQTQVDLASAEGIFAAHPERLAQLDEATTRTSHLLHQLLAYSRAESFKMPGKAFTVVALDEIVENSASVFLDRALMKNIDLGFEPVPVRVSGIGWMLQELLANLIDNAIRYTPEGGAITVRSGMETERPFLEVEDNGPGIPDDQRERVCERFYRVPGSTGNGCGLGLAIVSEIAQLHGAQLVLNPGMDAGLRVRMLFEKPVDS